MFLSLNITKVILLMFYSIVLSIPAYNNRLMQAKRYCLAGSKSLTAYLE